MTTKQPPAQKYLDRAKEIAIDVLRNYPRYDVYRDPMKMLTAILECEKDAAEKISAALQQVERDALASKVVFPTDETVKLAAKKDIGLHREDNRPKTCTNNDFYMAVTSSFIRGAKWALSKITLVPKEQVISPDIDKKEISNDMDNCVCDETHIHNCPVHTHLQDEPEVKAQGFEE